MSQELEGTLTNTANLVGTFGSEGGGGTSNYNDLINKPSINSVTLQGNKTASQLGFANVATSGSYDDLSNKPTIPAAQVNSDWNAVSGVAQILNKPTIPEAQVNSDWNASSGVAEILNKPTLSTVATSGDYDDLTNKPSIPAAQVNSDWNAVSGVAEILNKPTVYQNAAELPVSSTDPTDTKSYIDTGLSGKQNKAWTSLGNLTNGGTGVDVSNYTEFMVLPVLATVQYTPTFLIKDYLGTDTHIVVYQASTHNWVGAMKITSNILTYREAVRNGWNSAYVTVYAR